MPTIKGSKEDPILFHKDKPLQQKVIDAIAKGGKLKVGFKATNFKFKNKNQLTELVAKSF